MQIVKFALYGSMLVAAVSRFSGMRQAADGSTMNSTLTMMTDTDPAPPELTESEERRKDAGCSEEKEKKREMHVLKVLVLRDSLCNVIWF